MPRRNYLKNGYWDYFAQSFSNFVAPLRVSIDGKNNIYITDVGNNSVDVFDALGNFELIVAIYKTQFILLGFLYFGILYLTAVIVITTFFSRTFLRIVRLPQTTHMDRIQEYGP